ncbi:MAG: T9SS type A sorting domain-containing protein [Bacteroidota bacterium]
MKRLIWGPVLLTVLSLGLAAGQSMNYGYAGPFPPDSGHTTLGGIINVGLGVDPAGKVWVQTRSENSTRDSIETPEGGKARLFPIYVFNPDGSQASFSPIKILTGPDPDNVTVTDTLIRSGATGGNINPSNGNFAAVWGSLSYKPGPLIWEIDYKTGQGVRRVLLSPTGDPPVNVLQNNVASLAINQDGEYYLCSVLSGTPGLILNPNGTAGGLWAESVPAIGRAMAVSRDGNDVYVPRFTDLKTFIYHSDAGSLGPYVKSDSIFIGASIESIAIHPVTGYLWVIVDRRSTPEWTPNTAYAWDPATEAVVDSFHITAWDPGTTGPLPRGMAFSPTGDTVYVAHFDVSSLPAVVRFIKGLGVSVERDPAIIPTGYELSQNYPNPFNPSTTIRFMIAQNGFTTLKVYDMMGREVATLVEKELTAGAYKATFDAKNLTSGTYIYVLSSSGQRLANKMLLIK